MEPYIGEEVPIFCKNVKRFEGLYFLKVFPSEEQFSHPVET